MNFQKTYVANRFLALGISVGIVLVNSWMADAAGQVEQFNTVDDAVKALTHAAQNKDTNAIHAIFGPEGDKLISPDVVQAAAEFGVFVDRVTEKVQVAPISDSQATLQLGADGWPFPIPLVKRNDRWFFDTRAGAEEILNRRVGQNELQTIDVCIAYVGAQHQYASQDRDDDGVLEYAQRLRSTEGKRDGLYWSYRANNEQSPLGPLISESRTEGYRRDTKILTDTPSPYHGYYFKILTKQGKNAPGGKYNYVVNGNMIGGFALAAWPAEWAKTGMMTFIVNQQGKIFQKNLGAKTSSAAARITSYDPDSSWQAVEGN
jgi:hypothetical protein